MLKLDDLKSIIMLSHLTDTMLEKITKVTLVTKVDAGKYIFKEGDYASHLYAVLEGKVALELEKTAGNVIMMDAISRGYSFGFSSLVDTEQKKYISYAKALTDTTLLFFERANILAFSKAHSALYIDLCRWLSREVIMLEFKLTRDAVESIDRNLALLLIALANKYGDKKRDGIVLDLPISRQTMAEMLGVSIETLMRALKRFRERRLIATSQSQITLIDTESLKDRAQATPFYLSIIEETL